AEQAKPCDAEEKPGDQKGRQRQRPQPLDDHRDPRGGAGALQPGEGSAMQSLVAQFMALSAAVCRRAGRETRPQVQSAGTGFVPRRNRRTLTHFLQDSTELGKGEAPSAIVMERGYEASSHSRRACLRNRPPAMAGPSARNAASRGIQTQFFIATPGISAVWPLSKNTHHEVGRRAAVRSLI